MEQHARRYVLGIDLGSNSIGWAAVELGDDGAPCGLIDMGVRIFQAGVEGDIEQGKDESRNVARRMKRQMRRQLWRRTARMGKVFRRLQRAGLLPQGDDRHAVLQELERRLRRSFAEREPSLASFVDAGFAYLLRRHALDHRLEPFELGFALFHLGHRRGFKSNRKTAGGDKELGKVKQGISELRAAMDSAGARTLGEFLAGEVEEGRRIRGRWTARDMYVEEFERIWEAQERHHPDILTPELRESLFEAIFHQRPLKSQKQTVGMCELEPECRRAPRAALISQRFRYWQWINNLEVVFESGAARRLTDEERRRLAALAEMPNAKGEINLKSARKKLGIKEPFQYEERGESKLPGNKTAAVLSKAIGKQQWQGLSPHTQEKIVEVLLADELDDEQAKEKLNKLGMDEEQAENLVEAAGRLESGYMMHSAKAMTKLLEHLEAGKRYGEARKEAYPEVFRAKAEAGKLEPVNRVFPALRNPVVTRALTQLRKVVNALVRKYGRPERVHVELARDVKRSRKERNRIASRNRKRRQRREQIAEQIREELGRDRVSGADIEKVLLAEECNWQCPYTGRPINIRSLLGDNPQFDIEHIIPFSRSLDNSFINKTLCYHEENRARKRNKTPYEAYGGEPARFEEILARVRRFYGGVLDRKERKGDEVGDALRTRREKLKRFQMRGRDLEEFIEEFKKHQLQDTRYASRLAADYLGTLYGGRADASGVLRVQVRTGQLTAHVRRALGLHGALGDAGRKTRDDHRHHAIDALAVALTDSGMVKRLADASKKAPVHRPHVFVDVEDPWPDFEADVQARVDAIVVSHAIRRRVSGGLHEETFYSAPKTYRNSEGVFEEVRHLRRMLSSMKPGEVDKIVDPVVREAVKRRLAELGMNDPSKAFEDLEDVARLPYLTAKDGRRIPIRKARIRVTVKPVAVGGDGRERHVKLGNNHHMEVWEELSSDGKTQWRWEVVSMYEAYRRRRCGEPVVRRDHGPNTRFLFSLAPGDTVRWQENGEEKLFVVKSTSERELKVREVADARLSTLIRQLRARILIKSPSRLRSLGAEKVTVSPIGEVFPAHD